MERDKVEGRARLACCVVLTPQAMLQKVAGESPAATGRVRTADARRGQRAADSGDGKIVKLVKLLGCAPPVADVRLVPNLPVPGFDLFAAVTIEAMPHPLINEFAPLVVVLGRIGPARVNLFVAG